MVNLFKEDYATAFVEPEKSLATVRWTKKVIVTFDQYQFVYNAILNYHAQHPTPYFIADLREQGVMPPNYRKWFQEYVLPTAVKGGLKKAVVIFDGNVFKKYYLNHILDTSKHFGLPLRFENSVEAAEKWFKS
jgi:hypothetical protein